MSKENACDINNALIQDMSAEELVDKFAHMVRIPFERRTPHTVRYYFALRSEILRRMKEGEANA